MIYVIDYGLGNVQAFLNVYKKLDIEARRAETVKDICKATKLILPGVGAFDYAMSKFQNSGMYEKVESLVNGGVPILGVCVGMQLMGRHSDEGVLPGLGWIDGVVRSFSEREHSADLPLPHMGWNDVAPIDNEALFNGLDDDMRFYFLHSYYFDCDRHESVAATTDYGINFHSAVSNKNVYGVQFHPEKSHHWGAKLLKNFSDL